MQGSGDGRGWKGEERGTNEEKEISINCLI